MSALRRFAAGSEPCQIAFQGSSANVKLSENSVTITRWGRQMVNVLRLTNEERVRNRAKKLIRHLLRLEENQALAMVAPVSIQAKGLFGAKLRLKVISGGLRLSNINESDVHIDDIEIGPGAQIATMRFSFQIRGEWNAQQPIVWVKVDDAWYLKF